VFVLLTLLDLFSQRIWEDTVNCPLALEVGAQTLCANLFRLLTSAASFTSTGVIADTWCADDKPSVGHCLVCCNQFSCSHQQLLSQYSPLLLFGPPRSAAALLRRQLT
jgi:hypothetical protein